MGNIWQINLVERVRLVTFLSMAVFQATVFPYRYYLTNNRFRANLKQASYITPHGGVANYYICFLTLN